MILKGFNQLRCDLYKTKEIISLTLTKENKQLSKTPRTLRMMQIGKNVKKSYQSSLIHLNFYAYRSQQKFIDFNKDYYEILGVDEKAQFQQIKQKYYHLAKQYHPDRNKGNQTKFKEITQAYDVLSQQKLRKQYDERRSTYDDDDFDEKQNNIKNEQASSSLNYTAYSQLSKAQWAVYRSGKMNHSKTDYTNYESVYTPESGIDVEIKQQQQWDRAFRRITEKDLKEEVQFRQKLYKKHREDIESQLKARQEYVDKRLKEIGDKIQRFFGKKIRSMYDNMIAK